MVLSNSMVVWAYLIVCIILGFAGVPKMRTLRDYAFGTSQFSTTMLSLSMIATLIDSYNTIGTVEKAYSLGAVFALTSVFWIIRWNIMGSLLGPVVPYLRAQGCMTLIDIIRFYYGRWGRFVGFLSVLCEMTFLSIYYKSAAFILQKYLNMSLEYAAAAVTCVIALYCIFGGMHAIIVTDVVQFFIFVIVLPAVLFWGIMNTDVAVAWNNLPFEKTHITKDNISELISLAIYTAFPIIGFPFTQRVLMCGNTRQCQTVCQLTGFFACFFLVLMSVVGMITYGMNPNMDSNDALFYFVDHAVPASVNGFIAISFLAVIMSTASSSLNAINVVIIKDIIEPFFPAIKEKRRELFAAKIVGLVVVFTSFNLMFANESIVDMLWTWDNFYIPIVGVPFLMALAGIRIKPSNYKYVILFSLISVEAAHYIHGKFDTMTFCVGIAASAATLLLLRDKSISKMDRSPDYDDDLQGIPEQTYKK